MVLPAPMASAQDVAGVIQREGLAQALQPMLTDKSIVGLHPLQYSVQTVVSNHVHDFARSQAHGLAPPLGFPTSPTSLVSMKMAPHLQRDRANHFVFLFSQMVKLQGYVVSIPVMVR